MTAGFSHRTDEGTLRRCLERVLPDLGPAGAWVVHARQERAACATSYHASVLTVQFSTGEEVKLFLKDFRFSRLPKDGLHQRAERELRVYRDLLAGAGLGTARYCGTASDEAEGRLLLALEYVDGVRVRSCELEAWVAAARWLGRMQAHFARRPERWQTCDVLLRHDADFFRARAEGAVRAVSQVAPHLAGRLADVVKDYGRLVDVMAGQPRALVHGSYRPQNLLVGPAAGRVCPVDWELAAVGAPLYDLAFLSDGFRPPERDRLWHAYLEEVGGAYRPARGREEMRYVIDCFRLHKVLKSLSEAHEKSPPEATVAKLVGLAEGLGRLLARGAAEEEASLD
jgi:Phosphotransferase enzyme family